MTTPKVTQVGTGNSAHPTPRIDTSPLPAAIPAGQLLALLRSRYTSMSDMELYHAFTARPDSAPVCAEVFKRRLDLAQLARETSCDF